MLTGLHILDFSALLPGPFCTQMLADLGARVLQIEAPGRSDLARSIGPRTGRNTSYSHQSLHRGKEILTLDLKRLEARSAIDCLLTKYDIVIEQFRPGVMARLGLDYSSLAARFPALIYCSLSGYGQTGPWAERAGHDINFMALSGLSSFSGSEDGGPPSLGFQFADLGSAMYAAVAMVAAAWGRTRTGKGRHIDISMLEAAAALGSMHFGEWFCQKRDPSPEASLLNGGSYYGYYRTSDGRYMSVGGLEPKFRESMNRALGLDPQLGANGEREYGDILREIFAGATFAHWRRVFASVDACVEPVLRVSEMAEHPQVAGRDLLADYPTDTGPPVRLVRPPVANSAAHDVQTEARDPASFFLEFGCKAEDVAAWQRAGVFG